MKILNFNPIGPSVGRETPAPVLYNLEVSGSPSEVRDKLMNELDIDADLLEPWVLTVLLHAKNWCVHWDKNEHRNKSMLCEDLDWMIEKTDQLILVNQNHFNALPMQNLLISIYRATVSENHGAFSELVTQLRKEHDMTMDLTLAEVTAH